MKRNDLYRAKVENSSVDSAVGNQTITQKPPAINQNMNSIGTADAENFGIGLEKNEEESKDDITGKASLSSQLANHSEIVLNLNSKQQFNEFVFPEEYFKAMPVGEWVKTIS